MTYKFLALVLHHHVLIGTPDVGRMKNATCVDQATAMGAIVHMWLDADSEVKIFWHSRCYLR